jgi:hypothetical protein
MFHTTLKATLAGIVVILDIVQLIVFLLPRLGTAEIVHVVHEILLIRLLHDRPILFYKTFGFDTKISKLSKINPLCEVESKKCFL